MRVIPNLIRWLATWPLFALQALGWLGGWLAWLLSGSYRRRWLENTRQAGVKGWRRWASIGHAGMQVAELPRVWFGRPVPVRWDGDEHILRALNQQQGMLFLTPHMGCFEITAQAYARSFGNAKPMTVLFRPPRKAVLAEVLERARVRPGMAAAPATLAGVKQLIQALKSGEAVGLLPDQVPPHGLGVWAPFFDRPAYTMTLSVRFARTPGTQVLLAWGERLPWGQGFVVHVRPWDSVVSEPLARDPQAAVAQVNRAMEALISQCPEQYLWGYARYKSPRGASAPSSGSV